MENKSIEDLAREEQNRYIREWRKKNPEKTKAMAARYWQKRAERRLQEQQAQREKDV